MLSAEEISAKLDSQKGDYKDYLKDFDRTAYGAGSGKNKDRFSGQDIRDTFDERGDLSKAEGARILLDYAEDAKKAGSSMGGGSERELDKLRGYLDDKPEAEVPEAEPYQMSQKLAEANAGVEAFNDNILLNQGSMITGLDVDPETGKSSNLQNFESDRAALADKYLTDAFSLKLGEGFKPVNPDGTDRASVLDEERAVQGIA